MSSSTGYFAARDLAMHFGGIRAVEGVSFDVQRGEVFSIIGPNGAGMEQIKGLQDIFGSPPMTFGPNQRLGSSMSYIAVVKGGKWTLAEQQPVG